MLVYHDIVGTLLCSDLLSERNSLVLVIVSIVHFSLIVVNPQNSLNPAH